VSTAIYIESKIDNVKYCKSNGQFGRHLRTNQMTYQDYYEKYITKTSPECACGAGLAFYPSSETYAKSCGTPACRGKTISQAKQQWTEQERQTDSLHKKAAAAIRTADQKQKQLNKSQATFKKRYGVAWGSELDSQKEKSRQTKLSRYGDEKYNNSKMISITNLTKSVEEKNKINALRRATNLERYGVEQVLMTKSTASKTNKGNCTIKDYKMPSGKIVGVRGHEPLALDILFNQLKYSEDDVIMHDDYSNYAIEVFEYIAENRHHLKYYPDIYIPKENKIIEVKSQWWWDGHGKEKYKNRLVNNLKKRQAVIDKGYNYEVWIFENKYSYRILNEQDF